ncbi:MAG: hypothetical protein AAFN13_05850, partial [Bacteroidota bacterium]
AEPRFSWHVLSRLPRDLYDRLVLAGLAVPNPSPKQRERLIWLRDSVVERDDLATVESWLESLLPELEQRPVARATSNALADLAHRHPALRARIIPTLLDAGPALPGLDGQHPSDLDMPLVHCLARFGGTRARPLLARAVGTLTVEGLRSFWWSLNGWTVQDVFRSLHSKKLGPPVPSASALVAAINGLYVFDPPLDGHEWTYPDTAIDALEAFGLAYVFDMEADAPTHYDTLIASIVDELNECPLRLAAHHRHFGYEYRQIRGQVGLSYHEQPTSDVALSAEGCTVRISIEGSSDWAAMGALMATLNALPEHLGWSERFVRVMGDGQAASIMFGDTEALNEVLDQFWLHPHTYDRRDWWEARRAELRAALLADAA